MIQNDSPRAYFIYLDEIRAINGKIRSIKIHEYKDELLDYDLKAFKCSRATDLSTPDFIVLETYAQITVFAEKFKSIYNSLNNEYMCKATSIPSLLLKRRHIVLALMNIKLDTVRHYKKKIAIGALMNLYDQTYSLTVRLTGLHELIENNKKFYKYEYELA